jgi:hypothetical protein
MVCALTFVESEIDLLHREIFAELDAMTPAERERLPDLHHNIPDVGDEAKKREY